MFCKICNRYSGNASEVNMKQFIIDGLTYYFPVCVDIPHKNEVELLKEIMNKENAYNNKQKEETEKYLKEIAEKRKKEETERLKVLEKERRQKEDYKALQSPFELLKNKKAMYEFYKALKDNYENYKEGN